MHDNKPVASALAQSAEEERNKNKLFEYPKAIIVRTIGHPKGVSYPIKYVIDGFSLG